MKIKIKDIMDLLVFGDYYGYMGKHDLDESELELMTQALKKGNWRIQ